MRGKFDDVPTEELFPASDYRETRRRPKSIKSSAQGNCPKCLVGKIGLVLIGSHLVWRLHNKRTWNGTAVECMASGVAVCDAPETDPLNPAKPLKCPHE